MQEKNDRNRVRYESPPLTEDDIYLFNEGSHFRLYDKLGAHPVVYDGEGGTHFAVWAPNARAVSVMGEFNGWAKGHDPLAQIRDSGVWHGFLPGVDEGTLYKYHIESRFGGYSVDKADPFALASEAPPGTASLVCSLDYPWEDRDWMQTRSGRSSLGAPIAIYEVHLGSWRRPSEPDRVFFSYRELAPALADYVTEMGFTHVELLPIMEHPFFGSWGYQTTGYFSPTARYGAPQDLMYLVDHLHQRQIGVILDWVPSHFPNDEHGLGFFDGTHLFEHADPRRGIHPDWNSFIFNYGRYEVQSFLLSSAIFWLDRYHIDGLRVDAVASMLYLDYSRKPGEWIPNEYGGRENLEAIRFLRRFNEEVYRAHPDVQTIAEESTAWPMVSKPTHVGGLGFGMKWDMGWMHDTLAYMELDPIYRKYHHNNLTFRMVYAHQESFVLPLSHDEVVHGKHALLEKMPGDRWRKFANLRLLYGYMYTQPGKKLLFMGGELGQWKEWQHEGALAWDLLATPEHRGLQRWVRDLNTLYRGEPALHELDCDASGFAWVDCHDAEDSSLSYVRRGRSSDTHVLAVCNFTPVVRKDFRVGVPLLGHWEEVLNSDAPLYGGSGQGNFGGVDAVPLASHGYLQSISITLPPLAIVVFRRKVQGTVWKTPVAPDAKPTTEPKEATLASKPARGS